MVKSHYVKGKLVSWLVGGEKMTHVFVCIPPLQMQHHPFLTAVAAPLQDQSHSLSGSGM